MRFNVKLLKTPIMAIFFFIVLLVMSFLQLYSASKQVVFANQNRFESTQLATELRRTSDDLTRLSRLFVATGGEEWEQQYFELLDIQNGKKPRPPHYDRVYWDFRSADAPVEQGEARTISLSNLMKEAGFADVEFQKIKDAQDNSNDLVAIETRAMALTKGLFQDSTGAYTKQGVPDTIKALELMNDRNYHLAKLKVMRPINEFLQLVDERTMGQVESAQRKQSYLYLVLGGVTFLTALSTLWALYQWLWINRRLGGAPDDVLREVHLISEGNLRNFARLSTSYANSVLAGLAVVCDRLGVAIGSVRSSSVAVACAADEIAAGNHELSMRTEHQASALEETAASMEELSSTVKENAQSAKLANNMAIAASDTALRGGKAVQEVVQTMGEINESSKKINDIIGVVHGIAFQTNILALNAAVEAARAGENGRGFAVVASEVRTLAGRSSHAAKEIEQLINASRLKISRGSELADTAGQTISEVITSIDKVKSLMSEMDVASSRQADGMLQINEAITQLDQVTQQNAAQVEEVAAAASTLKMQAQDLVSAVSVFELPTHYLSITSVMR